MFPLKAAIKNSRVDYHSPHPRININFLLVAPSRFAQELSGLEPDLLLLQSQGNKSTRCVSTFSFMPEHRKKAAAKRAIHLYNFAVDAPFWQLVPVTLRRFLDENQAN